MPEYLAPGVYIEETSYRNKTIEGVSTSTAGFVGPTRFGPVSGIPELLTSYADFERIYGNFGPLDERDSSGGAIESVNHVGQSVRAFFDNGGRRLYVSRTFAMPADSADAPDLYGHARATISPASAVSMPNNDFAGLVARYPGSGGNAEVTFSIRRGKNVWDNVKKEIRGIQQHDIVAINTDARVSDARQQLTSADFYRVQKGLGDPRWNLYDASGAAISEYEYDAIADVRVFTLSVQVRFPAPIPRPGADRVEVWENLGFDARHERGYPRYFAETLDSRALMLSVPFYSIDHPASGASTFNGVEWLLLLLGQPGLIILPQDTYQLAVMLRGGHDGVQPTADDYGGTETDDPDKKSGLEAFEALADISIVAAPGSTAIADREIAAAIAMRLISHCEFMRYRIAVLDTPVQLTLGEVRDYRAQFDSTHAALYYPWVTVIDPITNDEADLPPSGFVAGIYARNDVEKGVHKAPANEVVRNAIRFEKMINKSQQDVLNPEGINCFRYFEGRGNRLWGARLASSDPEWKYVNLRRYFAYLERSIERGMQWVVFENNSELLWANLRSTVEDFLFNEWKSGHLMGTKSDEAYFVKCDRSTMTQNDLDNGRLVCLIGVSPVRPAEYVIFRIGQWTASAKTQ